MTVISLIRHTHTVQPEYFIFYLIKFNAYKRCHIDSPGDINSLFIHRIEYDKV